MDLTVRNEEKKGTASDWLSHVLIGMSDGLIVPFALTAGLTGAVSSSPVIIIAGIIAIIVGGIAMGIGGYTAGKGSMHHSDVLPHTRSMEGKQPVTNEKEARVFLANIGLNEEMQQKAIEEMQKDTQQWAEVMAQYDLSSPLPGTATRSALNIGLSYMIGGLIPVLPYIFTATPSGGLKISALLTLVCLFGFGFFRGRITGTHPWVSAVRITLTGALAAAAAFGAASLFEI